MLPDPSMLTTGIEYITHLGHQSLKEENLIPGTFIEKCETSSGRYSIRCLEEERVL